MEKVHFGKLFDFLSRSKLPASMGRESGTYPFYTSSPNQTRRTDKAQFSGGALIFGTGGQANIHYEPGPFSTSSECLVALPNTDANINIRYVYYYLNGNISLIQQGFRGVALQHISKEYLKSIPIPLCSREEQDRIVVILDRLFELLRLRNNTIDLLDELGVSLFHHRFGDLADNPHKYPLLLLEEFVEVRSREFSHDTCSNAPTHPLQLRQDAITKRFYDPAQTKEIRKSEDILRQRSVQPNDLLLSRKNTRELVGAVAFVFETPTDLYLPDTVFRLDYQESKISGVYLYYLLNDINFRRAFEKLAGGTMNSMSNISASNLKKLRIPYPPYAAQLSFEKEIRRIHIRRVDLATDQKRLQDFLNSVSKRIFSGTLSLDSELEIEALIEIVHLDLRLNDLNKLRSRPELLRRLIARMSEPQQAFQLSELYEKAAKATLQLLYEGVLFQEYDEESKRMKLRVK